MINWRSNGLRCFAALILLLCCGTESWSAVDRVVILKVDGREILVAASFRRMIAEHSPGDSVSLSIRRGTKAMSLNVKLGATKQTEEPGDED